jgi:biopolymer transport protein ExbB
MRIVDYIMQGGAIMYILLIFNIIGFAIMISKAFLFNKEIKNDSDITQEISKRMKRESGDKESGAMIELTRQYLSEYIMGIEKGLNTVRIIATVSPLLGLLGTVIGVLVAFNVMSQTGLNNPASFAQGISMALITTVGGLIVAIPHFIGHNYLIGLLDQLEARLEKKILMEVLA